MTLEEAIDIVMNGRYVKLRDEYILPSPSFKKWSKERQNLFITMFLKTEGDAIKSEEWQEISADEFLGCMNEFNNNFSLKGIFSRNNRSQPIFCDNANNQQYEIKMDI